jgi:hypothetical protein
VIVGKLIYNAQGHSFDIEDRALTHLRIVFMNKLRRNESFMFQHTAGDGSGSRSFWVHPSIPMVFHFYGSRAPALNRRWIEQLMLEASGPNGLALSAEPDADGMSEPERG